jgi:membrane-associated phospholipid phosphatase
MLLAYRESGLFIKADPAHRLDHLFILWDQTMLRSRWVKALLNSCAPWLQHYLELCYLLCYPLVPLSFAALYLMRPATAAQRQPSRMPREPSFPEVRHSLVADDGPSSACGPRSAEETARRPKAPGRRAGGGPEPFALRPKAAFWRRVGGRRPEGFGPQGEESRKPAVSRARFLSRACGIGMTRSIHVEVMFDKFWTAVLLATLFCYAVYPFFPLTPPRVLFNDIPGPPVSPLLRHMNLWLLDRLSVQACVFPSAHAAAVTAAALAVRAYRPRLGILFCIVALSIVVATVYGRYHYLADAVAGLLVGMVAFAVSHRIHKRWPTIPR